MPFSHSNPVRRTNEDVFFDYYPRLLEWAAQITHNDRSEAEDLVQDFYLRITRITRPIDEMEQPEGYLFRVLRNLYLVRVRQSGRNPLNNLSIVDYDSIEHGLAVADRGELLFVHDHLRKICRYACERKSTVRSASVLILRFFHGYYPSEVMRILQAGRSSVDMLLQTARNEARLSLERPEAIRCIVPSGNLPLFFSKKGDSTHLLFHELQEAVFSAVEGRCLERAVLERRYGALNGSAKLTAQELSHLVSCRSCLERVNKILDLPSLAERSPEDGIDRDSMSGPGGVSGSRGPSARKKLTRNSPTLRKMERRARELFEHRPSSLEIVVDGEVRSSQRVTAEVNELRLRLANKEEPSLIEVQSEQLYCLACLPLESPDRSDRMKQVETISLSDRRSLILTVTFGPDDLIVHVLYLDPVMAEMPETDIAFESANAPALFETGSVSNGGFIPIVRHSERQFRRWTSSFSVWLQRQYRRLFIGNMNPFLASAVFLTLGACVCLWLWHKSTPPMSANLFLQRAETADQIAVSTGESKVIAQKVRIRTASQTIERVIHRDTSGRRKPKLQPLDRQTTMLQARLAKAGVNWDAPLSAAAYQDWYKHSRVTRDSVQTAGSTLLMLTTTIDSGDVTKESLTVRAADFHPVERTISFRDTGNVEIAELDYNVMPWSAADPSWFEPVVTTAASDLPAMHAAIHLPRGLADSELDEAELGARTVLNQLQADAGEPISLARTAEGMEVKGVVDTNARKRELLSRLALIPNVHASILSAEEIGPRPLPSAVSGDGQPRSPIQEQPSPLEQYLRKKNLSMDQLVPASDNLLDGSLRIVQAGVHLSELQSRFREVNPLPVNEQTQLETLSRNYRGTITAGIYANQQILLSLGFASSSPVPEISEPDRSGRGIDEQLRRYRQLCLEMVSNETGLTRSAPEIAREILDVGERIRLHLADTSTAFRKDNN
ncbi:RNA polymerase sigma factor [Granulicella mallensis]|uniref:RNA polymerase, sigma-24 subunit, ECF subfamily n=1 Tax=Granulicella mallensis (strain ATCC BAA-1857 / DSM 23137 / MP5ACTX8) TaxID=682795 RepID=G8NQ31_GRAMM|nr:sigma-70 family RNA polymerase sigma factor [Granulicella mallensis]AEU38365.1 RNA polymerase, sigma-24 subunit, ECF subfamily [Granulicella mallensis MP5ACTX8]